MRQKKESKRCKVKHGTCQGEDRKMMQSVRNEMEEEKRKKKEVSTCLSLRAKLTMNGPSHGSRVTLALLEYKVKACRTYSSVCNYSA